MPSEKATDRVATAYLSLGGDAPRLTRGAIEVAANHVDAVGVDSVTVGEMVNAIACSGQYQRWAGKNTVGPEEMSAALAFKCPGGIPSESEEQVDLGDRFAACSKKRRQQDAVLRTREFITGPDYKPSMLKKISDEVGSTTLNAGILFDRRRQAVEMLEATEGIHADE